MIGWLYERFGQSIKAGNNLVIDTFHDEGPERLHYHAVLAMIAFTFLQHQRLRSEHF